MNQYENRFNGSGDGIIQDKDDGVTTHVQNTDYYKMASLNSNGTQTLLAGYKGLVNSTSSFDNSDIQNSLFTNFAKGNPYRTTFTSGATIDQTKAYTGALNQYCSYSGAANPS
jgi:hypothetical protein